MALLHQLYGMGVETVLHRVLVWKSSHVLTVDTRESVLFVPLLSTCLSNGDGKGARASRARLCTVCVVIGVAAILACRHFLYSMTKTDIRNTSCMNCCRLAPHAPNKPTDY